MISVFSCSNRRDNNTIPFAQAYTDLLKSCTDEAVELLDFRNLNSELLNELMYDSDSQTKQIKEYQDKYLLAAKKWIFVIPEYNGSFPGILKLFIDACSIRQYKETFANKKAALIGISEGRSGNIRGMEHLSGILNHVGTIVYPDRLPVSQISKFLDKNQQVSQEQALLLFENHISGFLKF